LDGRYARSFLTFFVSLDRNIEEFHSGVRKRVLNQAGATKGKQGIEQMQREFFRKRQKYEAVEQSEATVQDTIFEKLESVAIRRKIEDHSFQNEPNAQMKSDVQTSILSSRSRLDLNMPLGKPFTPQSTLRKDEYPAPLKSQSLRLNSMKMDAHAVLHEPNTSFPNKPTVSLTSKLPIPEFNDRKNSQAIQDWPLGKPIAYVKPISSTPAVRKVEQPPIPLKSLVLGLGSIQMDIPVKPSSPAMQQEYSNPSKCAIPLSLLTNAQSNEVKTNAVSSASPCVVNDGSTTQHIIVDDNIEMRRNKIPKFFNDASTQCVSEPEMPQDLSHQTADYQLPANYSQLPRTGQYLWSQWIYSANIIFCTLDVTILSQE
jgi:hypothetical protein